MTRFTRVREGGGFLAVALSGVSLVLLFAGCSATSAQGESTIRLEIRDASLRVAGDECSGAGALRVLHETAAFEIVDDEGAVIASGALPSGVAEKEFDADFGQLSEPTRCTMNITVSAEVPAEGASLHIAGYTPLVILDRGDGLLAVAP